jgi:hypothetical protein
LLWRDGEQHRRRCAEVGCGDGSDGLLKANVWYTVNDQGEWVEGEPVNNATEKLT